MKFTKGLPVIGAALLVSATSLSAQVCTTIPSCKVSNTASATVGIVAQLTLSTTTTDLGTPSQADYLAGHKDVAGPTATVLANTTWHVAVVGNTGTFSCTGSGCRTNKPSGDLLWGTVSGTYGNNAGTGATLFSGAGTTGSNQASFFRTNWNLVTDTPGTYTLVVNYTLSEP